MLDSIVLAWFAPGCATTQIAGGASGSIEAASLSVGSRQYQLDACSSGDLEYFLGVDLADQKGGGFVRVVIDPLEGPQLRIALRNGGAVERVLLRSEQCERLDAAVSPTGWEIDSVRDVSGYVEAQCRSGDGREIRLHARFSHCH
jgi:hypothetical protein